MAGDLLDGLTVRNAGFSSNGLNDSGQIAFTAVLSDGTQRVWIATPVPEPSTFILLAIGAIGLLFGRSECRFRPAAFSGPIGRARNIWPLTIRPCLAKNSPQQLQRDPLLPFIARSATIPGMYEIFEHTADMGIRVRAESLDELFADAARGLFSVMVENFDAVRAVEEIDVSASRRGRRRAAARLAGRVALHVSRPANRAGGVPRAARPAGIDRHRPRRADRHEPARDRRRSESDHLVRLESRAPGRRLVRRSDCRYLSGRQRHVSPREVAGQIRLHSAKLVSRSEDTLRHRSAVYIPGPTVRIGFFSSPAMRS